MSKQIILGIDPGSRFTGFGVVEKIDHSLKHIHHGVVVVPPSLAFYEKLNFLHLELNKIFLKYQPNDAVVEKIFFGKNADSAFKLGHVRGVCLQLAAQFSSSCYEYAAKAVKKSVTGNGAASKEHVRLVVKNLLKIKSEASLDASDALALTIAHSHTSQVNQLLKQQQERQREGRA